MNGDDDGSLLGLPRQVVERVGIELSDRGKKAVSAIQTSAFLISQGVHHGAGLRLAESAVYNLREALDAVVEGRTPTPGGLSVVVAAWERYEREVADPDNDDTGSLETFKSVLRRAGERQDRDSFRANQLLDYLQDKSGIAPLKHLDPAKEYQNLRAAASRGLHTSTTMNDATALHQRTVAWFVRMFTPPDDLVLALRNLAEEPWQGTHQIDHLKSLISNPHHLRLFFIHLTDERWLTPLYEAALVPMPDPDSPWPVHGLVDGLGRSEPAAVAAVIEQLLADTKKLHVEQQLDARFELLLLATRLGPNGYGVIGEVAKLHRKNEAVRSLATAAAREADPTDPLIEQVGRAVLEAGPHDRDSYYYRLILDPMYDGMNAANAERRIGIVAAKLRQAVNESTAYWPTIDTASLTTALDDSNLTFLPIAAHYLACMLVRAHSLSLPSQKMLNCVSKISGEIGERLTCRVLALSGNIPLDEKIDHVTRRLVSSTATGDDKELIDAVLATDPDPTRLASWADALGTPSPPSADPAIPPSDWRKVWRWSALLPEYLLTRWQDQISSVREQAGSIDPSSFSRRTPTTFQMSEQSPLTVDALNSIPVLEAARKVAAWRPVVGSGYCLTTARALARTLRDTVATDPESWTADPTAVVDALREPIYVLEYIRALADTADRVLDRTEDMIAAIEYIKTERWIPTTLSSDLHDYEPGWDRVEEAAVDLIAKLANHNAPFAEKLDTAWSWSTDPLQATLPDTTATTTNEEALGRAFNNARGRGLQAALALAGWEHRNGQSIRSQFFDILDEITAATGEAGSEFRAVLATQRPRLERIARDWLDLHADILFRGDCGPGVVDLTIKYCSSTPWLRRTLRAEIVAAALRGTENAVANMLIGALRSEPGYEIASIIAALRTNPSILAQAAAQMAELVQDAQAEEPELVTAVDFWRELLKADHTTVPDTVLRGCGRWSYVTALPDDIWSALTLLTLERTNGSIDHAISVADRCKAALIPEDSTKILLLLQNRGAPWERHYIANTALETLRALSTTRKDQNFHALRTRLIELGHSQAGDIIPYADPEPDRSA